MTVLVVVAGGLLFLAALGVGLRDWRWPLYGVLVYLPVSGIAIDAAYGHRVERAAAVLAKDVFFLVPAYVGFLVAAWRRRERISFPGAPVTLITALAVLVIVQAFNPALPNRLVGLVGAKVWLFYLPLLFLGYHLVRTRRDLQRVVAVVALGAVVPAVIGIAEAVMVHTGHEATMYGFYGDAAGAVTQDFTSYGLVRRIPSTFASAYQYYLFLCGAIVAAYAWLRTRGGDRRHVWLRVLVLIVLLGAVFTSGVRGAYLFVPLLALLVALLDRTLPVAFRAGSAAAVLVGGAVASLALGAGAGGGFNTATNAIGEQFGSLIVDDAHDAVSLTWRGLGSGVDSNGARYAFPSQAKFLVAQMDTFGRKGFETGVVKVWVELGALGLAIVAALFGVLVYRALKRHLALRDPRLVPFSAAFVALAVWLIVYSFKAQYLDYDPVNVYFWLFLGMAFKLGDLGAATPEPDPARPARVPAREPDAVLVGDT